MKKFLLLSLLITTASLSMWAQTAANYRINTVAAPSTCQKNGAITITVTNSDGTPLNMNDIEDIQYDVRLGGTATSVTGGYTTNHIAGQLSPGTYDVYVKLLHKTAGNIEPAPRTGVVIDNQYVSLVQTYDGALRESYTLSCAPTGGHRVMVTAKPNSKYGIRFTQTPESYSGPVDFPDLSISWQGQGIYDLSNLSAGTYKYQVYNECEGLAIKEFTIRHFIKPDGTIASDFPILNNVPYELQITNTCSGIAGIEIFGHVQSTGPFNLNRFELFDLYKIHYQYSRSSAYTPLYSFFDYATVTREEVALLNAGTITENDFKWRTQGEQFGAESYKSKLVHRFQSPYPTYADLRNPEYVKTPVRLYLRVRGSDCISFIELVVPEKTYQHEIKQGTTRWNCELYTTSVSSRSSNYTVCKREFFLYEVDAEGNKIGDDLLTETNTTAALTVIFNVGKAPLYANKQYEVKVVTTDYEGVEREEFVRLVPPTTDYLMRSTIEAYFKLSNCPWSAAKPMGNIRLRYYSQESMNGMIITLVDAPEGYDATQEPGSGLRMLKEGESFLIPQQPEAPYINSFYPFSFNDENGTSTDVYVNLPAGDYTFKYESVCAPGKKAIFTIKASYPTQPQQKNELQVTTEVDCDYIRLYPFRNQIVDYSIDAQGRPVSLQFKFSGHTSTSTGSSEFIFNPAEINTPKVQNFYITVPKRNNVVIKADYQVTYISSQQYWGRRYNPYPYVPIENGGNASKGVCTFHTQEIIVDFEPLTYDRDTYYGYRCENGNAAQMGIMAINGVGPFTYELRDINDRTKVLERKENIAKGIPAVFQIDGGTEQLSTDYWLYIKDLACPGIEIYEKITIYDLNSPAIIRVNNPRLCVGDRLELQAVTLGVNEEDYQWIFPNGEELRGRTVSLDNITQAHGGYITLKVYNLLCTPFEKKVFISVSPHELWWRKDAQDRDWHNFNNWNDKNGNPVQAIPAPCTTVHIPGEVNEFFPDLLPAHTSYTYNNPACDSIYFHFGSQVNGIHLLEYTHAIVHYNFGKHNGAAYEGRAEKGNNNGANNRLMQRDRWYMLAAPLKGMVSGDFGLDGMPKAYQRLFNVTAVNPTGVPKPAIGDFTTSFNHLAYSLSSNNNALAVKVNPYGSTVGYSNQRTLNNLDGIIELPFFNRERADNYLLHRYEGGTSYFRYYNEETLRPVNKEDNVARDANAYRFVFEDATGKIGVVNNELAYSMPYTSAGGDAEIMIGNPFMATIDFDMLYQANTTVLENTYRVFENGVFSSYSGAAGAVNSLTSKIAPLQGFIVKLENGSSTSGSIVFPARAMVSGTQTDMAKLRSAAEGVKPNPNLMYLDVEHTQGTNRAILGWEVTDNSVRKMIHPDYADSPAIYFVDTGDNCNEIQFEHENRMTIPIGVIGEAGQKATLKAGFADKSVFRELVLIDKGTGARHNLLLNNEYKFTYQPDRENNRFLLRAIRNGVNYPEEELNSDVKAWIVNNILTVEAFTEIGGISLIDSMGKQLFANNSINSTIYTQQLSLMPGVYIVSVRLKDNSVNTIKLYVR